MVVVFVVGVVYDVVDKFWQIIDMIGKEEERQAVLVHVVFMFFMVLTRSARYLPRSVSSRVFTDLMGCHYFENWYSLKKEIFYKVVSLRLALIQRRNSDRNIPIESDKPLQWKILPMNHASSFCLWL